MSDTAPEQNHTQSEQSQEKNSSKITEMCQIIYYDFSIK